MESGVSRLAEDSQAAVELADNLVDDPQAEAVSLGALGGEWFEQIGHLIFGNMLAIVADGQS